MSGPCDHGHGHERRADDLTSAWEQDLAESGWLAPPKTRWRNPGQRQAAAAQLHAHRWRVDEIAEALDPAVSRLTVLRDLRTVRKRQKRLAEVFRLQAEGLSMRQIARQLGVTEGTVRRDLKKWEAGRGTVVELRNPGAQSKRVNQARITQQASVTPIWRSKRQGGK